MLNGCSLRTKLKDGMTKLSRCEALECFMDKGTMHPKVEQWVIRNCFNENDESRLSLEQSPGSVSEAKEEAESDAYGEERQSDAVGISRKYHRVTADVTDCVNVESDLGDHDIQPDRNEILS